MPCPAFPASRTPTLPSSGLLSLPLPAIFSSRSTHAEPVSHHLRRLSQLQRRVECRSFGQRKHWPHLSSSQRGGRMPLHILCSVRTSSIIIALVGLPKRRFPSSAYAFFRAAVFHLGSAKLFARSLCVPACSRFQPAIRQRPWRTFFFFNAR